MADASYVQTSFLGGEWSPLMQGRIDLPKYRMALNLCLNGIPVEEGAWVRRSGTQFLGPTYRGAAGRVIGYEFQEDDPTLLELTNGLLRVWYKGHILTDTESVVTNISTDASPVFTVTGTPPWVSGESVVFNFSGPGSPWVYGGLQNRQFVITMLSASTFTCVDELDGLPLTQAELLGGAGGQTITAQHIIEYPTPWFNSIWQNNRFISLGQGVNGLQSIMLNGATPPQTITAGFFPAQGYFPGGLLLSLEPTAFQDGPYLDPVPDAQLNFISSSQTLLSYRLFGGAAWSPATGGDQGRYNTGDLVNYQGFAYISTIGGNSGSNTGNIPGTSTAWVLVNPTITGNPPDYNLLPWVSGGSYTPWNTPGATTGSVVTYNGGVWIARNAATASFSNTETPANTFTNSWFEISVILESQSISGIVGYQVLFQPWFATTTYTIGDSVTFNGINYRSLVIGNLGLEPDTNPAQWVGLTAGYAVTEDGTGLTDADVGRMVRLFYQPATWVSTTTYFPGVYVTYNGAYYQAQDETAGQIPSVTPTVWTPVSGVAVAFWTWGQITSVQSPNTFQMEILGLPLTDSTPISIVQFGVYTNSGPTWPTVGLFYQGRLWLMGAVPNRADASKSDDPFNFAPTEPDGTVQDNDGISITFLSEDNELIQWAKGSTQGILIGTLTHERLIQASTIQEPLTPASTEEAPVTHYGGAFIAAIDAGLATLFVQRHGRQVMEMVTNVFSGKYNAPNLALTAKHLTATNVEELAYQEELTPTIWARTGSGQLIGCTYRRVTAFQTDNPALVNEPSTFAAWHQHQLGTGRSVISLTNTFLPDGSLPTVAMVTEPG